MYHQQSNALSMIASSAMMPLSSPPMNSPLHPSSSQSPLPSSVAYPSNPAYPNPLTHPHYQLQLQYTPDYHPSSSLVYIPPINTRIPPPMPVSTVSVAAVQLPEDSNRKQSCPSQTHVISTLSSSTPFERSFFSTGFSFRFCVCARSPLQAGQAESRVGVLCGTEGK